jgi:Leucine-rich repeat (LRR) protein
MLGKILCSIINCIKRRIFQRRIIQEGRTSEFIGDGTKLDVYAPEFSVITPDIIREDGTYLDFYGGLGGLTGNVDKLRDEDVVNFLNDHDVNPDRVTKISLYGCYGMTDKALIAIADTCHNLTYLDISYCSNVTGHGIDAIARKCRKLKTLDASSCNISHLPEDIGLLLPHLTHLALRNNNIKKIPASLGPLADTLTAFNIDENPIQQPPRKIAKKGLHAIRGYYDELADKGEWIYNTK